MNKAQELLNTIAFVNEAMDLKINGFSIHPIGGNNLADIEYNGKKYQALKQGGLGIWAFPERPKMSREDQKELDAKLDAALKANKNENYTVGQTVDVDWDGPCKAKIIDISGDKITLKRPSANPDESEIVVDKTELLQMLRA